MHHARRVASGACSGIEVSLQRVAREAKWVGMHHTLLFGVQNTVSESGPRYLQTGITRLVLGPYGFEVLMPRACRLSAAR